MNKNIILAGVGGQGILTMSGILIRVAEKEGFNFRQSEVHGMSQRGGSVECHIKITSDRVFSPLIPRGTCDLIIGLEPLEALRYTEYLSKTGVIVTNSVPVKNIKNYPDHEHVLNKLKNFKRTVILDAVSMAKEAGNPYVQNMVLLGAASPYAGLKESSFQAVIRESFGSAGETALRANLRGFESGLEGIKMEMVA
ncbi:indolepyruvate oxidoreductase subunit beta [Elusimicrobiota bacterium]